MREDPKWNIERPCVQDHEHVVIKYYYTTTVLNITPFNVPKIGEEIEIVLDKVISVLVGAVLWNPTIGSLLVKSFNRDSSSVVITSDNLLVDYGKSVLANTEFLIGIPDYNLPTEDDYLNAPYLAADFISPGEGACQNASVTTVAGIDIGNKVSISGYVYRVGAVIDKSTLQLCNDGEGAPEGTVLAYDTRDCGKPSVPVLVYPIDPCTNNPVQTGKIVVCKDDNLTTIEGQADGQLLRWNHNFKRWELVDAYLDENCTYLTACFTVDILPVEDDENPPTYLATVKTTSKFNVDNKVLIEDQKFIVEEVVDDTHLRLAPEATFVEITTYPTGTPVCLESCCAWVPAKIKDTIDSSVWRPISLTTYMKNIAGKVELDSTQLSTLNPDSSCTTTPITASIQNTDINFPTTVTVRLYTYLNGRVDEKNSASRLSTEQQNILTVTKYELNSSNQIEAKTDPPYIKYNTDTEYNIETGTSHRPISYFISQELFIELPAYDEDYPELSLCTIVGEQKFTNLQGSNTTISFGTDKGRGSMETYLYIQTNQNSLEEIGS